MRSCKLKARNKNISLLIKIALLCVITYFLWERSSSASVNFNLIVAGAIIQPFILGSYATQAIRHILLIGPPTVRFRLAARSIILSQGLNLILPGRLSELLKATYLRDHAYVPLSTGLSAIVLERTTDLIIFSVLALIALINYFDQGNFALVLGFSSTIAAVIFLLVRFPTFVYRVIRILPFTPVAIFFERVYLHFSTTARTRTFWLALLFGLITWGFSYVNILVFLEVAGKIPPGFSGALLVFVMTTLGGAIPALPGGLGTYEAAAVIALRSLGYSFEEAVVLSIAMHASQLRKV